MTDFETARLRMVDNQLRTSNITDRRLLAALSTVPREQFVPKERADLAYTDVVHPIGRGRWLAAPAPFAKLLQLAAITHTDHVLDVGAGNGYGTAILAALGAEVTGLESDAMLADAARRHLVELGLANVRIVDGALDGSALVGQRFDVIVCEGALDAEPTAFFRALKDGGRLVALIRAGGTAVAHVFVRSGDDVAGRADFNGALPPMPQAPQPEAFVF